MSMAQTRYAWHATSRDADDDVEHSRRLLAPPAVQPHPGSGQLASKTCRKPPSVGRHTHHEQRAPANDIEMTSYETLIARADEETLGQLVGKPAVGLLRLLDPRLTRASVLRRVVTDLHAPSVLLRDPAARCSLLMLMRPSEAAAFARNLSLPGTPANHTDPYRQMALWKFRVGSKFEHRLMELLGIPSASKAPTGDGLRTTHTAPRAAIRSVPPSARRC